MKEKLVNALGSLGMIIWFLGSIVVYILPFVMIGASFWLNLLFFGIVQFFPASSVIFWIWGLVCAIKGVQDIWAIIYYVLFVIMFLPFFLSIILDLFRARKARQEEMKAKQEPLDYFAENPDIKVNWRDQ